MGPPLGKHTALFGVGAAAPDAFLRHYVNRSRGPPPRSGWPAPSRWGNFSLFEFPLFEDALPCSSRLPWS